MDVAEREIFTFKWLIQNFSSCPQQTGEFLQSPTFTVDFLNKSEWMLCIYPRGQKKHGTSLAFYLVMKGDYAESIGCALAIVSIAGKEIRKTIQSHEFQKHKDWGFLIFCAREEILNVANGYLPNDILTLKCEMWKIEDGNTRGNGDFLTTDIPGSGIGELDPLNGTRSISSEDGILSLQTRFDCNECVTITRINVFKRSAVWSVKEFGELRLNKKLFPPIFTTMKATPSFLLTWFLTGKKVSNQSVRIEITRLSPGSEKAYFVRCKIGVFNAVKRILFKKVDEHFFNTDAKNDVWVFPDFIDVFKLKVAKNIHKIKDILYLHCELSISTHANVTHGEEKNFSVSNPTVRCNGSNSVVSLFRQLRYDEELSDVILRSGKLDFNTHKIVLVAHSPVFKAMFQNNMMERERGVVNITDIDDKTLHLMLNFMYGFDLKNEEYVDAVNLYSAADKYEILSLKRFCSYLIRSRLSVATVVSTVTLADLHQDDELKSEAKNFIRFNITEVLDSDAWAEFMESNCKLAGEIMFNLLKDAKF